MKRYVSFVPAGMILGVLVLLTAGCDVPEQYDISVDKTELHFTAAASEMSCILEVTGDVDWFIEKDEDWVTVDPEEGSTSRTITVSVDRTGLDQGTYKAVLQVVTNRNIAVPVITVTMSVGDPSDATPTPSPTATPSPTPAGDTYSINMISLTGGTFEMGCSPEDNACYADETPRHTVAVSAFKMSTHEITQAQWRAVMGSNPSYFSGCGNFCPVENVSWNDVQEFIERLNFLTGKQYRLPTEAEWEYAARAGNTTPYYCGDDESCLDGIAWDGSNADAQPHPVGQKVPNSWGLYDMSGNVWEWCQDWYAEGFYEESPEADPPGPDTGLFRVLRGGSWGGSSRHCRSSNRQFYYPSLSNSTFGFRLCHDVQTVTE